MEEILDILEDSLARDGQNTIDGLLEHIIKIHTHLVEKSTHCMYYGEDHESRIKEIIETHDEMMKQKKIYKSLNKKLWELLPKDFKYY